MMRYTFILVFAFLLVLPARADSPVTAEWLRGGSNPPNYVVLTWTQADDAPACIIRIDIDGNRYPFPCIPATAGLNRQSVPTVLGSTYWPQPGDVWIVAGVGGAVIPTRPYWVNIPLVRT
jgi:hypothetical protein